MWKLGPLAVVNKSGVRDIMEQIIGIIAGVGPFAGLDLMGKILAQTAADTDQEHLDVISISQPSKLPDRTGYLLGEVDVNPAYAILDQLVRLEQAGATVAGIPCNTAHAPEIFDVVRSELAASGSRIRFLHMVHEVAQFLRENSPGLTRIGLLATMGTYSSGLYGQLLGQAGFELLEPATTPQKEAIHRAIYDPAYGIKSCGEATAQAKSDLLDGVEALRRAGAEAVILGCTEIPIAIREPMVQGIAAIDPTLILARALIREAAPGKLKPWPAPAA